MLVARFTLGYLGLLAAVIIFSLLTGGCLPPWRG